MDAVLASISTEGKLLFLSTLTAYTIPATAFWVGMSSVGDSEIWMDGTLADNQPWVHHSSNASSHLHFAYNGAKVVEESGFRHLRFICERQNLLLTSPQKICSPPTFAARHSNSCFWLSSHPMLLDEANISCHAEGGSIADLSDIFHEGVDHFYTSFLNDQPFWLNTRWGELNTTFQELFSETFTSNSSGSCMAISFTFNNDFKFFLHHMDCAESMAAICRGSPETIGPQTTHLITTRSTSRSYFPEKTCPHGYNWKEDTRTGFCFWETSYETERLSWNDARAYCQSYGGDLASFHSNEDEVIGLSFQYGSLSHPYWIGLTYNAANDSYIWADGSPLDYTNWASGQPSHQQFRMKCVQMDAYAKHWIVSYCGQLSWFVCKAPKQVNPQMPVLPTPEPMQTCSFVSDSTGYMLDNYCYKTFPLNYGWHRAQLYCENNDGNLVSIHSEREVDFLIRVLYQHKGLSGNRVWIGLNSQDIDGRLHWSDGSEVDFVNWNINEPNNYLNQEHCCNMYMGNAMWNDENCNNNMAFICKKRIGTATDRPTTTASPVVGNCKEGWYAFNDYCYLPAGNKETDWISWADASLQCKNRGGNLASVRNAKEQAFLTFLIQNLKSDTWIGFHDTINEGVYYWIDNSPKFFTNWAPGEPSFSGIEEDCVILSYNDTVSGVWRDTVCNRKLPYICQAKKDPNITVPWIPKPVRCIYPQGWLRQDMSCYMLFRNESTLQEANDTCMSYHARLVSINDITVEAVVKYLTADLNSSFWIGLFVTDEFKFEWSNGFPLMLSRWDSNEPYLTRSENTCLVSTSASLWKKAYCNQTLPFICQITSGQMPVLEPHLGTCPSGGWVDIGDNNCYSFKTEYADSWSSANFRCFTEGSNLASIHSLQQLKKLKNHLGKVGVPFLIGLTRNEHGGFAWSDLSPVDFVYWDQGEPGNVNHRCVDMVPQTLKWRVVPCFHFKAFICSISKDNGTIESWNKKYSHHAQSNEAVSTKLSGSTIVAIVVSLLVIIGIIAAICLYFHPIGKARLRMHSTTHTTSFENALFNADASIEIQNKNTGILYVHD